MTQPLIVFSHGNSFPACTYRVMLEAVRARGYRVEAALIPEPSGCTLTVAQVDTLTTAQIAALSTAQTAALTTAQIASLPTSQIASLQTADLVNLTTAQIVALTTAQAVALTTAVGALVGGEAIRMGVDMVLAPNVNLARSPLAGRAFEYYSEEPLLAGLLGAAWASGLQSTGTASVAKHLVCNDSETGRDYVNVTVDERTLREVYLLPFELAAESYASELLAILAESGFPPAQLTLEVTEQALVTDIQLAARTLAGRSVKRPPFWMIPRMAVATASSSRCLMALVSRCHFVAV
mgnify:CR=1 FL=1